MLPGTLIVNGPHSPWLPPDDTPYTRLQDFELGGVGISDPSQGLTGHTWELRAFGDALRIRRGTDAWAELFTFSTPYEIALAFDQNMRPVVAVANRNKDLYLYWYDPTISNYTLTFIGHGRTPRLSLDDKRPSASQYSDVILGYVKNKELVYRQQRDRFLIEYPVMSGIHGHVKLTHMGMGENLRMQFKVSS